MKKRLILLLLTVFSIDSQAQVKGDTLTEVEKFIQSHRKKDKERRESIARYSQKMGVPIDGYDINGVYMYLHHIDVNGRPIYYKTRKKIKRK